MKGKKPKKRYHTANQIRDEIDRYKARMLKLEEQASQYDRKAKELIGLNDPKLAEEIGFNRTRAKQVRHSIGRIADKRLHYLAQKLAEFTTEVLPHCGIDDRSISA